MIPLSDISPTADEAALARLSYLNWERSQAEELAEYVYRRRTVDLASLVSEAVDTELTAPERTAITKVIYEQKTLTCAAGELGINKATLNRTLSRAVDKLQRCLGYVVKYQYNTTAIPFLPIAVREALVLNGIKKRPCNSFGERICKLRLSENIKIDDLSEALGISARRISLLESNADKPSVDEVTVFSLFFNISTDYLLKGKDV